MKKVFLVFPLAILLANCSSTHNSSGTSANTGTNASISSTAGTGMNADASTSGSIGSTGSGSTSSTDAGTTLGTTSTAGTTSGATADASTSGTTASGSTSSANTTTMSGSGSMNSSTSGSNGNAGTGSHSSSSTSNSTATPSSATTNWDVYDPNNYMMNPEKYRRPSDMGKSGGWTYNKDWRKNTNFTAEAVGQWQLVITPEVAANWMPDTRKPEMYASFWTPEAVAARFQASMAAAARAQDSIAALNPPAPSRRGRRNTAMTGGRVAGLSTAMNNGVSGSGTTGAMGTGGSASMTGSGTTGAMGTGGVASTTTDSAATSTASTNVNIPYALKAVNGNNFMLPALNMYIDNGSFTAYTGCNDAVGTVTVNGSSLHFDEATPSTNVECIGGFDQSAFIERLRRADSYDVVNNQFRLKQGEQVLMVFQKNAQ